MIWRKNFAVKVNFSFFHTALSCMWWGNCGNLFSRFFGKNFVKTTFSLKKLLKNWFDEIFLGERNALPHASFFPSNQFIVKFFAKSLIWRNFCGKTVAVKFRNFHSVWRRCVEITITEFQQKFRENNIFTKRS